MLPTDWRAWAFLMGAVAIIMAGLIIISALAARAIGNRGIKIKGKGVQIGDHECTKGPLFERILVSLDLLQTGMVPVLDWVIKQGANGNTQDVRDSLAKNASAWQQFLIAKGVRGADDGGPNA